VKRVIAVPGDRLRLLNKRVWVNGTPVNESYAVYKSRLHDVFRDDFPASDFINANVDARWWLQMRRLVQGGELLLPANQYFVLGDNRDESLDSRYWGFVPRENIIGRPLLIYWSVEAPENAASLTARTDDKLSRFAYVLTHIFQETRWSRTFRLVK